MCAYNVMYLAANGGGEKGIWGYRQIPLYLLHWNKGSFSLLFGVRILLHDRREERERERERMCIEKMEKLRKKAIDKVKIM